MARRNRANDRRLSFRSALLVGATLIAALAGCDAGSESDRSSSDGGSAGTSGKGGAPGSGSMLHRDGRAIVDAEGRPVLLRGMAFGNDVWSGRSTPVTTHHTDIDFDRLQQWGMNAVRFYLNYQLFEDDRAPYQYKSSGFEWIDRNVAWAKARGVYLILNVHVPPGGFQSNGDGGALWADEENRKRLIALWRAIAERYRDEPAILGFDILNEPRPTGSRAQWSELAGAVAAAIREVDVEHLLVVERTNSVGDDWSSDADMNFFLLPDENVLYEFHFYEPIEYTHQFASWVGFGEGGKYPDESLISGANLSWYEWSQEPSPPPYAPPGDSDWTLYESEPYELNDPKIAAIGVTLVSELNAGTAYFDDLFLKEYDSTGTLVATVYSADLESLDGWYFWKAGSSGSAAVSTEHRSGKASLAISGTDHDASLSGAFRYAPKPGHRYSVGGYIKGVAVSNDSRPDPRGNWTQVSRALVRLDYFSADGPLLARNKAALEASVDRYAAWAEAHDVPLYLGEFGLMHFCFEDGRGGVDWVSDMLDILAARRIHFTYHTYHEPGFGVFLSDATQRLPDMADANLPLISTFEQKLR
jgi:endoglucanase